MARPVKRRKLNGKSLIDEEADCSDDSNDSNDLLSDNLSDFISDPDLSEPELPRMPRASSESSDSSEEGPKRHPRIHIPTRPAQDENTFVSQLTQPKSSPSRIRGPRWKRVNDEPRVEGQPPPVNYSRPVAANRSSESQRPANNTVPEDVSAILAENPDFFADDLDDAFDDSIFLSDIEDTISRPRKEPPKNLRQTTLFGQVNSTPVPATQRRSHNWPLSNKTEQPTHHKLDQEALKTWVYPTNLGTIRDYQYNITQRGLFHNLLVALPTGLGKTFIAATVMLNWYRWTQDAQIIFVAPTKPLVAQQVDACFNIVGIPRSDTSMLTGNVQPALRAEEWRAKRVFFMTPQTLLHDLTSGICDPKKIVLLVVDEAHRATGNYAYVEVVRFLRRFNPSFRVLALTATPGSLVESVQNVIDGLEIARVEIRTEDSLDIRQYVHRRNIEIELFDYSEEVTLAMDLFSKALQPIVNKLNSQNAYWGKDPMALTAFGLTKARQQWMASDAGRRAPHGLKGMINTIFSLLASLAHAIDLLKYHGVGPFYRNLVNFKTETFANNKSGKYAKEIANNEHFKKLMGHMQAWINHPEFLGHPKLAFLKNIVLNHFLDAGEGSGAAGGRPPSDTRIMIFVHFRDSAEEVTRILKRHEPMIRPHVFVGQAGSKGSEGMDQKTQLDIIQKFKSGVYNTLVATSIGEEGLDIGEVDLIVCYDSSASPIRMLQRMGRTGRKRAGNIYLLLMRGKEEDSYMKAKDNYEKMQSMIADGSRFNFHEENSPRIIPRDIQPVVDKRVIDIPIENTQSGLPEPKKGRRAPKKPPKKFFMPDGVMDGFVKASRLPGGRQISDDDKSPEPPVQRVKAVPIAPLPPLEKVLLSTKEEAQLEHLYQNISGDSPEFVHIPDLGAFPLLQRTQRRIDRVPHSKNALSLNRALSTRPSFADRPRPSRPPHVAIDTTSAPDSNQESDVESVNNATPSIGLSSQEVSDVSLETSPVPLAMEEINIDKSRRFYVSQESVENDDDSADDLPSPSQLWAQGGSNDKENRDGRSVKKTGRSLPPPRRKRRMIVDDDDDE